MALPTREEFHANLVPISPSCPHEDPCPICYLPLESAVRLPCFHIFCHDCITTWLDQENINTCPFDRRELFALEWPIPGGSESPFQPPTPPPRDPRLDLHDRESEVRDALDMSGLLEAVIAEGTDPFGHWDAPGALGVPFADLRAPMWHAVSVLSQPMEVLRGDYWMWISADGPLRAHLAAASRINAFAVWGNGRDDDDRYVLDEEQRQDWYRMVEIAWEALRERDGNLFKSVNEFEDMIRGVIRDEMGDGGELVWLDPPLRVWTRYAMDIIDARRRGEPGPWNG